MESMKDKQNFSYGIDPGFLNDGPRATFGPRNNPAREDIVV